MSTDSLFDTAAPFSRPLYVMLKPVGSLCNLKCTYCYYLDKKDLYPSSGKHELSEALLEQFIRQYLESQTVQSVLFTWHGGEPLLRGIPFYRKAMQLQRQYGRGLQIDNTLQTNGTLLTDEWCRFFKEHGFLIGISVDGMQPFHDSYRRSADGRPSFVQVMKGIELLYKHGVEFNIMGVVNDLNVDYPLEFYRFFKQIGAHFIQFAPIVERFPDGRITPWSVAPGKWGDFLIAIFNDWVRTDVGNYYVNYFDCALANWMGVPPGICIFAENCGHAGVMEFNGDLYSCDHFVYPEYKLGNLKEKSLIEMMYSPQQQEFGLNKSAGLSIQCKQCEYLFACRGECPKNRIDKTPAGEPLNYLCPGYHKFFKHISPYMDFMEKELREGRAPANIMYHLSEIR